MNYCPQWDKAVQWGGYRLIYCPDHPNAWRSVLAGYVYEHRLIVEQQLGRLLRPDEHVHHVNGERSDNRPVNLQVMTNAEHARLHRLKEGRTMVTLNCPSCLSPFTIERRQTHLVKRQNRRTYCSRRCVGSFTSRHRKWRPAKDTAAERA